MSMTDIIKEAYIDPIRSVMVVDDEYPTLTNLISGQDNSVAADKERLSEVIEMCRNPANNWMLDVHDGNFTGTGDVDNLHHSDLLILDYHLEGNGDDGRGESALNVLSTLALKEHFNLVVVHTKGYTEQGADEGYLAVFKDIVFHLQSPQALTEMPAALLRKNKIEEAIDAWEIEEEGVLELLINCISDFDYLSLCAHKGSPVGIDNNCNELLELKSRYDARPIGEDEDLDSLDFRFLKWFILHKKGGRLKDHFGSESFNDLRWSKSGDHMWVKAGNLFVNVVGKSTPTSELPEKLSEALEHWCPHPHRLLLAKLRHKMDEHGFTFASDLLNKHFIQAGWLRDLLECDEHKLDQRACLTAQNHLEELSWHYKDDLSQFLSKVVRNLIDSADDQRTIENSYSTEDILTNDFEIFKSVNAFNNSIPLEGLHLNTGHVLKDIAGNYFLVVTPACDLEPGRTGLTKIEAVVQRLYPVSQALKKDTDTSSLDNVKLLERSKELVNSKQLIFIPVDGGVEILATVSQPFKNANPNLVSLAFANEGKWCSAKQLLAYSLNLRLSPPQVHTCVYEVVGQLRYEYALHHSKTSGEHVSRIGLDYSL